MYGTCETLCRLLSEQYPAETPLNLIVWSPADILAKGRPALPQNPLPDVLGWKYSGNRHHPTEKPVTSLRPLTESFIRPNAIVLDPFAGSGSTCVAALQAGRRYIGIELLEQYHSAGVQRLAAMRRAVNTPAANDEWTPEAD